MTLTRNRTAFNFEHELSQQKNAAIRKAQSVLQQRHHQQDPFIFETREPTSGKPARIGPTQKARLCISTKASQTTMTTDEFTVRIWPYARVIHNNNNNDTAYSFMHAYAWELVVVVSQSQSH